VAGSPPNLWAALDWKLQNTVGLNSAPERTVQPKDSFNSDTTYWVSYARKGDSPNGGELYGAYKTQAEAKKAVEDIKKWADRIDKDLASYGVSKSDWQIDRSRISIEKMGGPGKEGAAKPNADTSKGATPKDPAEQKQLAKYNRIGALSASMEADQRKGRGPDPATVSQGYFMHPVKAKDADGKVKYVTDPKTKKKRPEYVRDPVTKKIKREMEIDKGGPSYGLYQLTSRDPKTGKLGGNVSRFVKRYYPDEFKGLEVNSPPFVKKWLELAQSDPEEFSGRQSKFAYDEYYQPLQQKLLEGKAKFDLDDRSLALQQAALSTSVQFGQGGAASIIGKALKSLQGDAADASGVKDEDLIRAIYKERERRRPADATRYQREMEKALDTLKGGPTPMS
jgi:hypothetical protein